jgi:hypothetical protein
MVPIIEGQTLNPSILQRALLISTQQPGHKTLRDNTEIWYHLYLWGYQTCTSSRSPLMSNTHDSAVCKPGTACM